MRIAYIGAGMFVYTVRNSSHEREKTHRRRLFFPPHNNNNNLTRAAVFQRYDALFEQVHR